MALGPSVARTPDRAWESSTTSPNDEKPEDEDVDPLDPEAPGARCERDERSSASLVHRRGSHDGVRFVSTESDEPEDV